MKQLRNLYHKQLQLSCLSHDDTYNLHEIAYDIPGYIHKIITLPDLVCVIPLIHERKFANKQKELFKQCVQDIPAIRKASYDQCHWSQTTKPDCSVIVPFRAFRILVGGTVPFRSGF